MDKVKPNATKTLTTAEQNIGHRQRLRRRFAETGLAGWQDYEVLELILFYALPRCNTKDIAKSLLKEFPTLSAVLSAPTEQLTQHKGVKEAAVNLFRLMEAVAQKISKEKIFHREVIGSWQELIDYCYVHLADRQIEEFHVLMLDSKNRLIRDEIMSRGTTNHTTVYPREVIKRALTLNVSSIILVHNHPNGDPSPSKADEHLTQEIKMAAERVNIRLHDHLVIGREGHVSFKEIGLL